jgi:putative ATPase
VAQQYLPDALQGRVFYQPGGLGHEAKVKVEVERRREAQLAAMLEGGAGFGAAETLTFTGDLARGERDRWLARAVGGAGERLASLRDRVLDASRLQRHGLALDLNAGSGLLTWEALRRAPEGGVWSLAFRAEEAAALREVAARLPEVERPVILHGALDELHELLALRGEADVRFDAIVGRGTLASVQKMNRGGVEDAEKQSGRPSALCVAAVHLANLLRPGSIISLAEPVPRHTQRLYALVDLPELGDALASKVRETEEAIYADPADPLVNWDEHDLRAALLAVNLTEVTVEGVETVADARVSPAMLDRWFSPTASGERSSYVQRLASLLNPEEIAAVEALYRRKLTGATVPWRSVMAYVVARRT